MSLKTSLKTLRTALLPVGAILLTSSLVGAAPIAGGTTTVNLNSTTVGALVGLGFSIAPVAPATANLTSTPPTAVFQITGGDTTSQITHSGGLSLTNSGTTATIQNFVINLAGANANTLTGDLVAGGSTTSNVAFFNIGAGAALTVNPALASALSAAYGIPNLSGAPIGTAVIAASTVPEPASVAFVGLAGAALALVARRKRSARQSS